MNDTKEAFDVLETAIDEAKFAVARGQHNTSAEWEEICRSFNLLRKSVEKSEACTCNRTADPECPAHQEEDTPPPAKLDDNRRRGGMIKFGDKRQPHGKPTP